MPRHLGKNRLRLPLDEDGQNGTNQKGKRKTRRSSAIIRVGVKENVTGEESNPHVKPGVIIALKGSRKKRGRPGKVKNRGIDRRGGERRKAVKPLGADYTNSRHKKNTEKVRVKKNEKRARGRRRGQNRGRLISRKEGSVQGLAQRKNEPLFGQKNPFRPKTRKNVLSAENHRSTLTRRKQKERHRVNSTGFTQQCVGRESNDPAPARAT